MNNEDKDLPLDSVVTEVETLKSIPRVSKRNSVFRDKSEFKAKEQRDPSEKVIIYWYSPLSF